jgi:hypothetical protein
MQEERKIQEKKTPGAQAPGVRDQTGEILFEVGYQEVVKNFAYNAYCW